MRVILNCAMSADGKIALPHRRQTRISNEEDMRRVHMLRNRADAILVGIGTILADDPKLTVSEKYVPEPRSPLRIVLDSKGRTPEDASVLKGRSKTLIVTSESCSRIFKKAETVRFGKSRVDIPRLLSYLEGKGVKTLLVEGGETVMWSFLRDGVADELDVFIGSMIIGGEKSPTLAGGDGFESLDKVRRLLLKSCERLGDGALLRYDVIK